MYCQKKLAKIYVKYFIIITALPLTPRHYLHLPYEKKLNGVETSTLNLVDEGWAYTQLIHILLTYLVEYEKFRDLKNKETTQMMKFEVT